MEKFKEGLRLSRNFKNRKKEDTELLHEIILSAVELVQLRDDKYQQIAMERFHQVLYGKHPK